MAKRRVRPLVGLGFCLKPYHPDDAAASCPSGRANHNCLYFERREVRPVCSECAIYKIGSRCLDKGCPVYIMTSAKDIAEDFFLPQIDQNRYPTAILLLCPYSIQAILPPLLICRIDVFLLAYSSGSCADYRAWLTADRGIKNEMTELDGDAWNKLLKLLRSFPDAECRRFRREGDIYYPE